MFVGNGICLLVHKPLKSNLGFIWHIRLPNVYSTQDGVYFRDSYIRHSCLIIFPLFEFHYSPSICICAFLRCELITPCTCEHDNSILKLDV